MIFIDLVFMKREKSLFFVLIGFFCITLILAQNNNSRPAIDENCSEIVNSLRKKHGNDSIAIDIFKSQYRIINLSNDDLGSLLKKDYIEMIHFFNIERGKDCLCRSDTIRKNREEKKLNSEEILKHYILLLDKGKN